LQCLYKDDIDYDIATIFSICTLLTALRAGMLVRNIVHCKKHYITPLKTYRNEWFEWLRMAKIQLEWRMAKA